MNNPLSSNNVALEVQQYIADGLNQSPELSVLGITVIPEDKLDIEYQIKTALQKQGICTIVMTPELDYIGHNGKNNAYELNEVTVQTVEYVPVNRAKNKEYATTALDVSQYVLKYMTAPDSPFGFGKFNAIGVDIGEDNGLLVSQAKFKTYVNDLREKEDSDISNNPSN